MSHAIGVTHEVAGKEGYVELKFKGVSVDPGKKPRMNPPGKAHDGWAPYIKSISDIEIEHNEFLFDLDPDEVYEEHQDHFDERLLEEEAKRHDPRGRNPRGV